jgi:hypothetical protein
MKKRLWQRVGIGLIVTGFGLYVWVQADPASTVSGAVARGVVSLAYAVAMIVWVAAGLAHVLLNRHFSPNWATDGPEADYIDRGPVP